MGGRPFEHWSSSGFPGSLIRQGRTTAIWLPHETKDAGIVQWARSSRGTCVMGSRATPRWYFGGNGPRSMVMTTNCFIYASPEGREVDSAHTIDKEFHEVGEVPAHETFHDVEGSPKGMSMVRWLRK